MPKLNEKRWDRKSKQWVQWSGQEWVPEKVLALNAQRAATEQLRAAPAPMATQAAFCARCGAGLAIGAQFCERCGTAAPTTGSAAAAGWFPDPTRPGQQRYWNGQQWTETATGESTPEAKQSGTNPGYIVFWIFFFLIQVGFVFWIFSAGAQQPGAGDCYGLTSTECSKAFQAGQGIAIVLIIFIWAAIDIIMGVGFLIGWLVRNSKR